MSFQTHLNVRDDVHQTDLVSWTFGNLDYDQDRKIYLDPENHARTISASMARVLVRKLVAGFKAIGLQPGDCVCVHAFNDIMYTMLLLSIIGAGGRFTGSNPAYTSSELSQHLRTTKARLLITESEILADIAPSIEAGGLPVSEIFLLGTIRHDHLALYRSWEELLQHGESDWRRFEHADEAKTTTAALLSTSGTTGLPKAAMISHYSCVMQNIMLNDSKKKTYEVSRLISLPEFHAFAFPIAHIAPLREGIPTYIMRRFDLKRYLAIIDYYQITETPMVPPMMLIILKAAPAAEGFLKSLRLVWSAGAPLGHSVQDQMYTLLTPSARIVQVWGMTETGWITTFSWPEMDHTGSVGRLLPGMEAKLIDEKGDIIDYDNYQAEIFIRGPLLMQGYLGNPDASTAAFDVDGWLRTGDVAYKDQGKIYVVDRKKEMIKVRGWQVSPAELEETLLLHPDISDAAVIGVTPFDDHTELPRAYIVRAPKSALSAGAIKSHISFWLANYKRLDGGVVFTDTIPKSSAGKILKTILRDRAIVEMHVSKDMDELTIPISTLLPTSSRGTSEEPDSPATSTSDLDALSHSPLTASSVLSDADKGNLDLKSEMSKADSEPRLGIDLVDEGKWLAGRNDLVALEGIGEGLVG